MPSNLVEQLWRDERARLVSYLIRMTGNRDLAYDVAQDAFVALQSAYRPEEIQQGRSLLYSVAINFARMHLRRERVERRRMGRPVAAEAGALEDVPEPNGVSPDRQAAAEEMRPHLMAVIEGLQPRYRDIFLMAQVEGRTYKEIAVVLGISEKRVDKCMTKALRRCREGLLARGIERADVVEALVRKAAAVPRRRRYRSLRSSISPLLA
ncbi:MAG TPA: RNA polymerase sigma factor [Steroidobacteraceae bacterium]|nr:RNA polymerase sigma factor [Steroidobacteraceae bacterium]